MNALELLRSDGNRIKAYNEAMRLLETIQFDQVLAALEDTPAVPLTDPLAMQMASGNWLKHEGWKACQEAFSQALTFGLPAASAGSADFGATKAMRDAGFTEDEIKAAQSGQ